MGQRMKIKAVVTYCWNTLVTLLNNVKDVSFSSKKWSQKSCMLLMVLPNSIKIIFVVSFFHHLFKHPTKCKIFWNGEPHEHSFLNSFWSIMPIPSPCSEVTAFPKAGFASMTLCRKKSSSTSEVRKGRRGE